MKFSCCFLLMCWSVACLSSATVDENSCESCRDRLDKVEKVMYRLLKTNGRRPDEPEEGSAVASNTDYANVAKRSDDTSPINPVVEEMSSKMTELEAKMTALQNDKTQLTGQVSQLQTQVASLQQGETQLTGQVSQLETQITSLQHDKTQLSGQVSQLQQAIQAQGSAYVRWGHTSCPSHADTIYTGYVGGSMFSDHGSGANLLCLPNNPRYDGLSRTSCGPSTIYGSEYDVCPSHHQDQDIVCAVCRSARSTSLMIPATYVCPSGWTTEYRGHIMSNYVDHVSPTEYVCVDNDLHDRPGGQANRNGALLAYTVSKCGSLPCPPYEDNRILSCVVCSR